jgi:hypothetical protein
LFFSTHLSTSRVAVRFVSSFVRSIYADFIAFIYLLLNHHKIVAIT